MQLSEFAFDKFLGISPRELIILACLNEYNEHDLGSKMSLPTFFFKLKTKHNYPIDVDFEDNLFPYSEALGDMLLSFEKNRIVAWPCLV